MTQPHLCGNGHRCSSDLAKARKVYPFEVLLDEAMTGLPKKSKALANQIRTIDKARLAKKFGFLTKEQMKDLDSAIRIHLAV